MENEWKMNGKFCVLFVSLTIFKIFKQFLTYANKS